MDLHTVYPGVLDLKARARRRIPHFVWEYLDSGTGVEATTARNRTALDRIGFWPSILHGAQERDLTTSLFGLSYAVPIGAAPVGMSGLIWPDAEGHIARACRAAGAAYTLSTVASQSPEDMAPHVGDAAWFQLYPPKAPEIRADMLARAKDAGFRVLVLTVDLPEASRRERQTRSGLTQPPVLSPRLLAQVAARPRWALGMAARGGVPKMRMLDRYITGAQKSLPPTAHIGYLLRTSPDADYVKALRDLWDGPLVLKGVLRAADVPALEALGVDGIWVSNHAGRQFDGAPAAIEALPEIRAATRLPLIFDGGVAGGLDILRAVSLGADLVMMGRAFHYAVAALGPEGPAHLIEILTRDMIANMGQMGAARLSDLPPAVRLDRL